MEVTEKWIREAVGWEVFKEAKAIIQAHKVSHFQKKDDHPHHFFAHVTQGKRTLKVSVKVNSETDIDAHCQCRTFRDSGIICEHIAAVLMTSLNASTEALHAKSSPSSPKAPSTTNDSFNLQAYKIKLGLPPNAFDRWQTQQTIALGVDLQPINPDQISPTELALNAILYQINSGQKPQSGFWQIEAANLEKLLEVAMEEKDLIFQLDSKQQLQPIKYFQSDFARLNLQVDGSTQQISLNVTQPKLSEQGELQLLYGQNRLWFWDAATRTLITGQKLQRPLNETRTQSKLLNQLILKGSAKSSIAHFWKNWQPLESIYHLELSTKLQSLELKLATPRPHLRLEGSLRQLRAEITFLYESKDETVDLAFGSNTAPDFFPYQVDDSLVWENRNSDFEKSTLTHCTQLGFNPDAKSNHFGHFKCDDEQTILKILLLHLDSLPSNWIIEREEKLDNICQGLERIQPQVTIHQNSLPTSLEDSRETIQSGQNWLAFDINFQTSSGTSLQRDKVRQLLRSGQRDLKLPNGKRGVLFDEDGDQIDQILLDVNPSQQSGSFFTSPAQALYLQRWQTDTVTSKFSKNALSEKGRLLLQLHANNLINIFRPYQTEGVSWLVGQMQQIGGALLADDMGLGKTLQTLASIHTLSAATPEKDQRPSLIVCPTSLVNNWRLEINKWLTNQKILIFTGSQRTKKLPSISQHDFVITTYGTLSRDIEKLSSVAFQTCVLDEASLIRNPQTKIAQSTYQINATYRLALTGTPVENTVRDLWSIFHFIAPNYLGELDDFRQRYEKSLTSTPVDSSTMQRLQQRVAPFYLRRMKQEVAKDLPSKTEIIERLELSTEQKHWYQEILTQGQDKIDEARKTLGQGAAHMELLRTLLRLRQTCCDSRLISDDVPKETAIKLERLLAILEEAKAGGHRVLIFSQFAKMLKIIAMELQTKGLSFCHLDGQTAAKKRASEVEKFQQNDGPLAFLISLKAGGYGLTLTKADIVIHFDPWWNPAVEAQATDRAHRIGQTQPVTVYKFITNNTVEEKVLQLQQKKKSVLQTTLNEGDDNAHLMEGLSTDEIQDLI